MEITISWQSIIIASICVLGVMEWIKGFANKAGTQIHGNILRILQLAFSVGFSFVIGYLPVAVIGGFLILSITTLCKNQLLDLVQNKLSTASKEVEKVVTDEDKKEVSK